MRIGALIKEKSHGVSFEFFPPKSSAGRQGFMEVVHVLKEYDPLYVSVTYGAGGSTRERTGNTLAWIREETSLTVMSHLTCIGATRAEMDSILRDYQSTGIDNVLALRGDPPRNEPDFEATGGEFRYAKDLVEFVRQYGSFSIGVAAYPEGHFESPSIEKDIEYTKMKVDAGADFIITQMFFDNRYFYDFMDRASKIGITVPVLPGMMPVTDCRKIVEFANFCNATVPKKIRDAMAPYLDSPDDMRKVGVEFATEQCRDLLSNGIRHLHFYTMNRSDAVSGIIDDLEF